MKLIRMLLPLAALSIAFAQPPAGNPPAQNFDDLKTYLGLTDNTIQSIQQAIQASQTTMQTLGQQLADKQKAIETLLATGTSDAAAVGKLVLEAEAIRKQIKTQQDALQSKVLDYLTADQKTKLTALQDAAKLAPAIQEAGALHLIAPPAGAGPGGPGGPGMRGNGPGPMMRPGAFGNGFVRRNR